MTTSSGARPAPGPTAARELPRLAGVVAVCAHPDDESFGLGAVLSALSNAGIPSSVLCFTHGERSTLGTAKGDLGRIRSNELAAAAAVLGASHAELLGYPDGSLAGVPLPELAGHVSRQARLTCAGALLVFDEGGITGHPDHCQATAAALSAADGDDLTVLGWAIPRHIAEILNAEFGTTFVGRAGEEIDILLAVNRAPQLEAIACHASQSTHNPVLWRRLELLGSIEHLRYLRNAQT